MNSLAQLLQGSLQGYILVALLLFVIGLATVLRIVRRHGGSLEADAEPGRGARFTFTLPGPDLPERAHEA